jgi:quinolinate synthase
VLRHAAFVGSTTALLEFTKRDPATKFIVMTEDGILHQMRRASPHKEFISGPPEASCACNECPYMKLNTLEKIYTALRDLTPRLEMDPELRSKARLPIDRMLALS